MITKDEFFRAISEGNENVVKQALSEGFDVNTLTKHENGTALNMTVSLGNVVLSRILIDGGANLEACTKSGMTPLLSAIAGLAAFEKEQKSDYLAIIEMLLVAGAKPTYINRQGEEEFAYLCLSGRIGRQIYDIFVKLGLVKNPKAETPKNVEPLQAASEKPAIQESHSFKKTYLPQPSLVEVITSMFFAQSNGGSEDTRPLIGSGPKLKQE